MTIVAMKIKKSGKVADMICRNTPSPAPADCSIKYISESNGLNKTTISC